MFSLNVVAVTVLYMSLLDPQFSQGNAPGAAIPYWHKFLLRPESFGFMFPILRFAVTYLL